MDLTFSPDGMLVATSSVDGSVRVCEIDAGCELARFETSVDRSRKNLTYAPDLRRLAFSPDAARLAIGENDQVRVWDIGRKSEVIRLEGSGRVDSVSFSPDGRRLGTGTDDSTASLWDIATGTEIARLTGRSDEVWSVAFSPEGRRLATGSQDGTVRIWDISRLPEGNIFDVACALLPDHSLDDIIPNSPIRIDDPICDEAYDPPLPHWIGAADTEEPGPEAR